VPLADPKIVDPQAEFHFVPAEQVMSEAHKLGAVPLMCQPWNWVTTAGMLFEAILKKYNLAAIRRWCCLARS